MCKVLPCLLSKDLAQGARQATHLLESITASSVSLQEARNIVPKLLDCLQQLPTSKASSRSLTKLQASVAMLLSDLHNVICMTQLPDAARHDISHSVKDLLASAVLGSSEDGPISADFLLALRGALHIPYSSSISLPLLPQHSAELLEWLVHKHMVPARDAPYSSHKLLILLLAARLYKLAARDRTLIDTHIAQQLTAVACR